MLPSIEKIIKVINLEIQGHFANKAIIGGLDRFLPTWLVEAGKESVNPDLIDQIQVHFSNYHAMDIVTRENSSKAILESIRGINSNRPEPPSVKTVDEITSKPRSLSPKTQKPPSVPRQTTNVEGGLNAPVSRLSGIGPTKSGILHTIGIDKIKDFFYYFPRRYDDYSNLKPINRIEFGEELTVIATVQSFLTTKLRNRPMSRVEVVVSDGTGFLRLVFFRPSKYIQSFESHFHRGVQLAVSGKVSMYLGRKQMENPQFESLEKENLETNRIVPVYPLVAGLTQKDLRQSIKSATQYFSSRIEDYLPEFILASTELIPLSEALQQVHFPDSMERLHESRNRLAFDEIFFLQLGVQQQKKNWHANISRKFTIKDGEIDKIKSKLPFNLTKAQVKVISEIREDLDSGFSMNRLIQGDVGSGKTLVAAIAAITVILNGAQVAFMVPTSILAEQHYQTLCKLLVRTDDSDLPLSNGEIRMLTGDVSTQERAEISAGLADGSIKLLVGTHALIEDPITFKNLQLAIIDEQHRFGIAQRSALRQKGENPHLLVMTATPIPRSLALTLFGDLDISIIDELPEGRQPVETQVISPMNREKAYQLLKDQINAGHQAFIIYPLIDKGDNEDQKAAVDEHEYLQTEVFPDLKLGLLHGRLAPDEKDQVMKKFRNKEFDALVSTTVIEVGVDIPNATVMLIEGANRFGLAQLHQLRGRVGRGSEQAYCLLIPETEDALENERLAVMIETNDGFVLAEKDLTQRGPGDFIGFRQSGYADLRMASITDIRLIEKARGFAEEIFKEDPQLEKLENHAISLKMAELWNTQNSDIS